MNAAISSAMKRAGRRRSGLLVGLLALFLMPSEAFAAGATYTVDADFDSGTLDSVNHDSPNSDQLQLNAAVTSTFPVMWISNAGQDSVSKIDTDTDSEVGRYCVGFATVGQAGCVGTHGAWSGPAPSRSAVDGDGNMYVAIRHFDGRPAEVVKILAEGGIDRNGNQGIETSSSSTMLPASDTTVANGLLDCNATTCESTDERIAWAVPVGANNGLGRSLCIGTDGNLWVGLFNAQQYYKISSADGSVLAGPISVAGHTPYGCLIDGSGTLWGASLSGNVLEFNTNTQSVVAIRSGIAQTYGIALGNGKVYLGNLGGRTFTMYDPATHAFSTPACDKGVCFSTNGIATDGDGNVLAGVSGGGNVCKFAGDGTLIWCKSPQPGAGENRGLVGDADGNVWSIHTNSNNISKFSGVDGAHLGVLPVGASPYTYSDATGLGFRTQTNPFGTWTVVYDSGAAATLWGTATWNASVPLDAILEVKVRAADTVGGLGVASYQTVSSGVEFTDTGQYLQVQVRFTANSTNESPVLYDLSIASIQVTTTTTSTTTTTTVAVCGNGLLEGDEVCDDGDLVTGDGCDDQCAVEQCWSCDGQSPTVCSALDGDPCDDGDACTYGDACAAGVCTATEVAIRAACDWVLVAGDPSKRVRAQTRQQSQLGGDICGDQAILGEGGQNGGDVAVTEPSNRNAIRVGPTVSVLGDIVTGGGAVRGKPRGTLLPGLSVDEVAGGVAGLPNGSSGVYDTSGSHAQVAACQAAQDEIDTASALLSGLPAVTNLGTVRLKRGASLTVAPGATAGVVAGAVNVVEFDSLAAATDATVTLDGGGNADTVYVIRVLGKMVFSLRSTVVLANAQQAKNVLFFSVGKRCHIGLRVTGSGVMICPNAKIKLNGLSTWDGALLGGKGKVFVGEKAVLTHQPFFGL